MCLNSRMELQARLLLARNWHEYQNQATVFEKFRFLLIKYLALKFKIVLDNSKDFRVIGECLPITCLNGLHRVQS